MLFALKSSGPKRSQPRPQRFVRPPTARRRVHVNAEPGATAWVLLGNSVKVVGPLLDFPFHASRKFSIPPRFSLPSIRPLVRKLVRVKVLSRMEHPPSLEAQDV